MKTSQLVIQKVENNYPKLNTGQPQSVRTKPSKPKRRQIIVTIATRTRQRRYERTEASSPNVVTISIGKGGAMNE